MTTVCLFLLVTIVLTIVAAGPFGERTLIIGTTPLARMVVAELAARPGGRTRLVGVVDDGSGTVEPPLTTLVVGPLSRLAAIIDEIRPDRIVIALADRRGLLP